jgi:hypothetical protein
MSYHDPIRQVNYIQQVLCQNKKPVGFFLSAGCPFSIKNSKGEPLIPNIDELTKIISDTLLKEPKHKKIYSLILDHFKSDGKEHFNIEDILSHTRALRHVAGKDTVRGLKSDELDEIDNIICKLIENIMTKRLPSKDTPYHKFASWIGATNRTRSIEIFTTNYDLLIEQAMEDKKVPYFDGFIGACNAFFDLYAIEEDILPIRWARLWKLHGSINWNMKEKGHVVRCQAEDGCRVIHPSHLKYDESRRMPYLAMIDRLRNFLRKPGATLIICGYSFRDEHVNSNILECLQGNPSAAVFTLAYGEIKEYPGAIKIGKIIPNFNLLAEDEAVIGTKQSSWTEKEGLAENPMKMAIEWIEKEKKGENPIVQAKFKLGDFVKLGEFLEEIMGTELKNEETVNA